MTDEELAQYFLDGNNGDIDWNKRHEYELAPEWKLEVHEYEWDGERRFGLDVILKEE